MIEAATIITVNAFAASGLTACIFQMKRYQAVPDSYERHKAATLAVAFAASTVVFSLVAAVLQGMQENFGFCLMDSLIACIWLLLLKQALEDDNWFNGQRRRFTKALKKFRGRFRKPSITVPLPSTT